MMPKFQPLLDRGVDSLPLTDTSGVLPEAGGAAGGEGVDGARPRSAFAELMSATDASGAAEGVRGPQRAVKDAEGLARKPKTHGQPPSTEVEAEPFAPSFDLPAFLQVLPRSGNEVAVAAAREPGLAAAVRRLPTSNAASEARSVEAPDVAIRLPSFLIPPKVDTPAARPTATIGVAPDAATPVVAQEPSRTESPASTLTTAVGATVGATVTDPVIATTTMTAATATTPASTAALPRTPTAALESAIRRAATAGTSKDNVTASTASVASGSSLPVPLLTDRLAQNTSPLPMSAAAQPLVLETVRNKSSHPPVVGRKESGGRVDAAGREQRGPTRSEPSGLLSALQRPFESAAYRSDTADRGDQAGRSTTSAVEMGPPKTAPGMGAAPDTSWASSASLNGLGERQDQATVSLRHPVGTEAWQDELSAQLSFMAEQGEGTEAVMKLAPEELGELEVRVEVRDGEAALQFSVANVEVLQAVESAQTKLRDLFTSQGMNVSEFKVFSNLSGNSQSSSSDGRSTRQALRSGGGPEGELDVVVRPRRSVGVVDLYA
jgi:flagellar hook-length control protein FliK